ncbi:hypothetical protein G6011_00972 [Alternaria panax]|uniref:Beta-lactamase-related domain-containing protein n=1 Tax=Alternaria panax TaxID=48097 RepID=A0AAD4IJ13_9PLEO|nr:hypothetical protein G6011_00972 [Alternaria panax]
MADFETAIQDAVAVQEIPGCALAATSRDESFTYNKAFGRTSMDISRAKPFDLDTMMWVASCTKLMTSICAMQLVESGKITLDEPVYRVVPELENFKVLTGFTDEGAPIEEKHKAPITLRNLLTHSSGLVYEAMGHPLATAYLKYHKKRPSSSGKLLERFNFPLMFEPGSSWTYGPGIDYAGLVVERISGLTLEDYMKKNLWVPLGITDITFFPSTRPDLAARMADMSERTETGKANNAMGGIPKHILKDYGLGGVINMSDGPDGSKAGTMRWGGYPNLIWWVDRKSGFCGIYGGQVVPPGDATCAALTRKWEEGVYGLHEKHRQKGGLKI